MLRNIVGNPVTGSDLFGREKELGWIWERLELGEHVHLLAPRRVGKTSLMMELQRDPQPNWHVIYVDAMNALGPAGLFANIVKELAQSPAYQTWFEAMPFRAALSKVRQHFRRTNGDLHVSKSGMSTAMGVDWLVTMEQLRQRLKNPPNESAKLLLILDELPFLLTKMLKMRRGQKHVELMLANLRSWRQDPSLRQKVHMLFDGSVDLRSVLRRPGLSWLANDMAPIRIDSWGYQTAIRFLQRLGTDCGFVLQHDHIELMLELLGDPEPYHIQLFFRELFAASRGTASGVTKELVRNCFEVLLSEPKNSVIREHYTWRLRSALDTESYEAVQAILRLACNRDGTSIQDIQDFAGERASLFRKAVNDLEMEGYIVRNEDRIVFQSNLLRSCWHKYQMGVE